MPTERTWQEWLERLYNLRRDNGGSHERPHKPVLLLSNLEIYDYTCAACGLRVRLNDGFSLVDAAHLIPFNVTRDDSRGGRRHSIPTKAKGLCKNKFGDYGAGIFSAGASDEHTLLPTRRDEERATKPAGKWPSQSAQW